MTTPEKIAMYQQQLGLPQTVLAGWMSVSVPTMRRTLLGLRMPAERELRNLSTRTHVPVSAWVNESEALPDPLPLVELPVVQRGRPERIIKPSVSAQNRAIIERIKALIQQRYEGNARRLSEALLMDETQLSTLLSGRRELSERTLLRMSRVLNVTVNWLKTGQTGTVSAPCLEDRHDGQTLRAYLTKRGLYWSDLQRAMGLQSLSSVVEYGNRIELRRITKLRIAQALQVPAVDLWGCL